MNIKTSKIEKRIALLPKAAKMSFCDKIIKYFVFLVNFLCLVMGAFLIGIGVTIRSNMSNYLKFMEQGYFSVAMVFIVIGVVTLMVSFFGCCGICSDCSCMVFAHAGLLTLILITLIGAFVSIVVYHVKIVSGRFFFQISPSYIYFF